MTGPLACCCRMRHTNGTADDRTSGLMMMAEAEVRSIGVVDMSVVESMATWKRYPRQNICWLSSRCMTSSLLDIGSDQNSFAGMFTYNTFSLYLLIFPPILETESGLKRTTFPFSSHFIIYQPDENFLMPRILLKVLISQTISYNENKIVMTFLLS